MRGKREYNVWRVARHGMGRKTFLATAIGLDAAQAIVRCDCGSEVTMKRDNNMDGYTVEASGCLYWAERVRKWFER